MKKEHCANVLCFVGNQETGRVLQSLIDKCPVLDAVIADPNQELFEKLRESKPVVAVIEDAPGKVDGVELVHKIRRSEESPNIQIPILLILSDATARGVINGSESGANQIITAPFAPAKLWECFEQVLDDTRKFVINEDYVGPERRGSSDKPRGVGGKGYTGMGRRRGDR